MHVIERGAGTPLILLHGFGVDHRSLLPLDAVFERAGGWRRLYLDLPGTAGTPVGEVRSTADMVDAVAAEITALVGSEPFALLGYSLGGMLARALAHRFRDRVIGLATVVGVVVSRHGARDVPEPTVLRHDPEALALAGDAASAYTELAVVQSPENVRAFLEHVQPGLASADPIGLGRIAARYTLPIEPEAASPEPWTRPALFLTARQDNVVGYRDTWATLDHYPRATFVALDAAGHNVHLDRPELTAALLGDWAARVRAER
ncbi:alpha/beta fold hydrolase [Mycetocola saprophilus]|uniref:alpha/beta fold hydrolase n=1 Tax=Mycetocola saprophilus TaxID=76636 RepID=UPI003BF3EF87